MSSETTKNNIVDTFIEVKLKNEGSFLRIKETLTRIGLASSLERKLHQSCHILHKKGKYYIVHFKELFALDGRPVGYTEADIARRNTVANLLEEWGLLEVVDKKKSAEPTISVSNLKIISHKEKDNWELVSKYPIGQMRYKKKTTVDDD